MSSIAPHPDNTDEGKLEGEVDGESERALEGVPEGVSEAVVEGLEELDGGMLGDTDGAQIASSTAPKSTDVPDPYCPSEKIVLPS